MTRWRRHTRTGCRARSLLALGCLILTLSSCGVFAVSNPATPTSPPVTSPYSKFDATIEKAFHTALASVHVAIPTRPGAPAPSLPADAFGPGLGSRVVLGFLPSWEIADAATVDYHALSEVAYYALQVQAGGRILESGMGWNALVGGGASTMVTDAHAAGDRALLTLYSVDQSTLEALAAKPSSGTTLADQVAPLLRAYGADGVDIDFEGQVASARRGFVRFFAAFSTRLKQINSSWSIVLNVFPQAAVDPESFFDVRALAPYADQLFVMAYDMTDQLSPGATAPLVGEDLSDASALASLVSAVPRSKLILGIPFYGYDFTATRRTLPADTIGTPYAVSYDSVVAAGRPARWDPTTETPYTAFKRNGQWHQTWYDDPVSVALKVALAAAFHIGGVGAWELAMANGQDSLTTTLDGGSPPLKLPLASHT
jgi:hypothetical protein